MIDTTAIRWEVAKNETKLPSTVLSGNQTSAVDKKWSLLIENFEILFRYRQSSRARADLILCLTLLLMQYHDGVRVVFYIFRIHLQLRDSFLNDKKKQGVETVNCYSFSS